MQNNALEFLKPRQINVDTLSSTYARVSMQPFERGFGYTLGNALRRILLSSMDGFAATEVTISGVLHEYSTMDGVKEDVVDILLNIKNVVFKLHGNRTEATVSLKKSGAGAVVAGDFELPHDVEVVNPDQLICNLATNGSIEMEIKVERGHGYQSASSRRNTKDGNKIGVIQLDASFSPISRVSVDVEAAVVGGALRLGGVGHGAVIGVDRTVDVAHPPHEEDVSGLDTRGVGGLETQRGLHIARLALVVGGAGPLVHLASITDRRILAAAAVNIVSPIVVVARRVASASTRVGPLPRVGVVAGSVHRVVHPINRVNGAHIGDLHRGVPQGNGEVTGGGVRGRRRPRERHHGHQDDGKRTDHRKESAQESFTPTPWAD